jgi:hypothetical protein
VPESPTITAIVCSRRPGRQKCKYCGYPSQRLCDYPLSGPKAGATCDVPMCGRCTFRPAGEEKDYCRPHRRMPLPEPPPAQTAEAETR